MSLDPTAVFLAIEKVFRRHTLRRAWRYDQARYRSLTRQDRQALAHALCDDIAHGVYEPAPATVSFVMTGDKRRELIALDPIDKAVHTVLAKTLQPRIDAVVPQSVCSFRKGESAVRAAQRFIGYLRAHRRRVTNVRERGVYVLRADVKSYGDTIPLGEHAPLWPMLERLCAEPLFSALQRAVRTVVIESDGPACRLVGLPTGSPLLPPIENLYLAGIDAHCEAIAGAFYARYGDDMLFAHPDPTVTQSVGAELRARAAALGLALGEDKWRCLYFNGAGRGSTEWPEAKGTTFVEYLGCRIGFSGTLGLTAKKWRRAVSDLRARIRASDTVLRGQGVDRDGRARALATVVERMFTPQGRFTQREADWLLSVVTDRAQLKALDHLCARAIAERLSQRKGPRAFREAPPRALRALGLRSFVARRNEHEGPPR